MRALLLAQSEKALVVERHGVGVSAVPTLPPGKCTTNNRCVGTETAFRRGTQRGDEMLKTRILLTLATAAVVGAGCARYSGEAGGDVGNIDPADAAKGVVMRSVNPGNDPMEL